MAIPFFHTFRSTNRGRGPKYTVPCPKGRTRRTRRQDADAEQRRAQKDISGPAVYADGGTGGRRSPLLSDRGMVGLRGPGDVYKMRLQIGVHNGAFRCSGTPMKRRKISSGKRCRLAFHAVDRGSNPLGDANEIMPLREIVRAFFVSGRTLYATAIFSEQIPLSRPVALFLTVPAVMHPYTQGCQGLCTILCQHRSNILVIQ